MTPHSSVKGVTILELADQYGAISFRDALKHIVIAQQHPTAHACPDRPCIRDNLVLLVQQGPRLTPYYVLDQRSIRPDEVLNPTADAIRAHSHQGFCRLINVFTGYRVAKVRAVFRTPVPLHSHVSHFYG